MPSDTTNFLQRTGISRSGTYLSLGLVISLVIGALTVVSWVNGMDDARGRELQELDTRLTRVETQNEDTAKTLQRIESTLEAIRQHLMSSK